uniref:VASt domain-containing protein n=1 Tax=Setaria digitata TaxID=48799 RepID=A0A915Q2U9_9BILA
MTQSLSSTTIFDLSKEDLSSILQTLKPAVSPAVANSMSVCELRTHITEWLMLNDLSTMQDFKRLENSEQWKVPDKADHCISCGKYRVTTIGSSTQKSMNTIIDQPLTSRESLVFVGRSTSLPSSVLQIIDFTKPLNPTIVFNVITVARFHFQANITRSKWEPNGKQKEAWVRVRERFVLKVCPVGISRVELFPDLEC